MDNDELIDISLSLKERRKKSAEGILYLGGTGKDKLDYLLDGDYQLLEKEKEKYLNYIIREHGKCLPKELLQYKLIRRKIKKVKEAKEQVTFD